MAAGFSAGGFVVLSSNLVGSHPLGILTMIRFTAFALFGALATSPASLGFEQARADESPA